MVWGWVVISCFTMIVGLAMAGKFNEKVFPLSVRLMIGQRFVVLTRQVAGHTSGRQCYQKRRRLLSRPGLLDGSISSGRLL